MARAAVERIIDTQSKKYADAVKVFDRGVVKLVDKLTKQGMNAGQIVDALAGADFTKLAGGAKYGQALQEMGTAYREVLLKTVGRHPLTESRLQALQTFTKDTFLGQATDFPNQIKGEVIKVVLGGGSTSDVADALSKLKGMSPEAARTEAATALSTYSRSVGYEQAKQDPPDMTYLYEGPVDDITRDICLEMAAAGALTLAEIEERFPGAFRDGGGWNCRHSWEPQDAAFQVDEEGARAAIATREAEGTWSQPMTARETLEMSS